MINIPARKRFEFDLENDRQRHPQKNVIYRQVFGSGIIINHFGNKSVEEKQILDRNYHIDVEILLPTGAILTGQEKILNFENTHRNTVTIEYMQNRDTGEKGEFFCLASQFFLGGYMGKNDESIEKWMIIDLLRFMLWLNKEPGNMGKPIPSSSNASFLAIHESKIPSNVIIAKRWNGNA